MLEKTKQKTKQKNVCTRNKGITLIALVITIIVLLILAGVSIYTILGDNGVVNKANEAKQADEISNIEDAVNDKVITSFSSTGEINKSKLLNKLNEIPGVSELPEDDSYSFPLLFKVNEYYAKVDELGNVEVSIEKPQMPVYASEDTSYVGYYADLDGNASNGPEGIIYADLAHDNSGEWHYSYNNFSYKKENAKLKKYTVGEDVAGGFGSYSAPVIKAVDGIDGTDRFYVMALEDLVSINGNSYYYWYYNGKDKMNDYATTTYTEFGKGKVNTNNMLSKYNSTSYGDRYTSDLWGSEELKSNVNEGWFVPSKDEWSAFGYMVENIVGNESYSLYYSDFGLGVYYWSSSQYDSSNAWFANFDGGYMNYKYVTDYDEVIRLSTTF